MSEPTAPQARFLTAIVDGHSSPVNVVGGWRPINACKANGWVIAVPAEGGRVTWEITPEGRSAIGLDATVEVAPLLIGKGQNGKGAEAASETDPELREKLAALAALEEYNGDSCGNASHNIRLVLSGEYDPRPDARHYGLDVAPDPGAACVGCGRVLAEVVAGTLHECARCVRMKKAHADAEAYRVRQAIPVPTPEEFRARLRAMSGTPAVPAPLYYLATDARQQVHIMRATTLCGLMVERREQIANGDVSRVDCLACLDRYTEERG